MKRMVGYKQVLFALIAGVVLCHTPQIAHSSGPSYRIFLQAPGGGYYDATPTSVYQEGHVYDIVTGNVIGYVPTNSFVIYNSSNVAIGYLSPNE
ncbi:MAG: hypothetical protein RMJ43_01220 [Chloroherpetonaceae bacterium]|nr:hypothetical protein [Chthonomonadaceae bacterium]MDW8206428.1 hypothetical protein [Chloroherpetonaceae bacterium]